MHRPALIRAAAGQEGGELLLLSLCGQGGLYVRRSLGRVVPVELLSPGSGSVEPLRA